MYIRRGQFTKALIYDDIVILQSICHFKETQSLWLNKDNPHLPQINCISPFVYSMPKYRQLIPSRKRAYSDYQLLIDMKCNMHREFSKANYQRDTFSVLMKYASAVAHIKPKLGEAITALVYNATNYTSYIVPDFKPQNFSVGKQGVLVLRDIFLDGDQLGEFYTDEYFKELTEEYM